MADISLSNKAKIHSVLKSAAASVPSRFIFSSTCDDRTVESMSRGTILPHFSYRITQDIAIVQLNIIPVILQRTTRLKDHLPDAMVLLPSSGGFP
jgi:hypothetical protein